MKKSINLGKITLGVCYYPEHWDSSMWEDDLRRMKECGIEVIRIAEFAWNKFEPEDGKFDFSFWDSFMEKVKAASMKVIFCTPTATPPIWLTEKYPEVLNADIDGNLIYHGTRRHYNMNSKIYREYSARITEKIAEHYVANENIIGWQLDNEINCENDRYYSKADHDAFREYCREKFKTLEAFNEAMGTMVWNQTYTSWDQVHLCRRTNTYGETNPHMQLLEERFISDTVIGYFKLEADIIRKYQKLYKVENQFITTNGIFRYVDYQKLVGEVLDFICYDNYPAFTYEVDCAKEVNSNFRDRNTSFNLTKIRSISENFGVMEQQSGAGGWNCRMKMPMPKPGQMRLWSLQAIAHGADFVSYFRWRTARFGTEIYWHGLLDYDNRDNRRITELKQIKEDVAKLSSVATSKVKKQVALVMDYDNEWDGSHDIWHGPYDKISYDAWFKSLEKNHIPFDFVYVNEDTKAEDLKDYSLVVYPHATIFSEKRHDAFKKYIEDGGKVIFGARSGYKDLLGQCLAIPMPGLIADLCGCFVKEYTCENKYDQPTFVNCKGKMAKTVEFFDVLEENGGEVVAAFDQENSVEAKNHYVGQPAVMKKNIGAGAGYYVGGVFTEELVKLMLDITDELKPLKMIECDEIVELVVRQKDDADFVFVLNYENRPHKITLKNTMTNMLTGEVEEGEREIAGFDCLVYKL